MPYVNISLEVGSTEYKSLLDSFEIKGNISDLHKRLYNIKSIDRFSDVRIINSKNMIDIQTPEINVSIGKYNPEWKRDFKLLNKIFSIPENISEDIINKGEL